MWRIHYTSVDEFRNQFRPDCKILKLTECLTVCRTVSAKIVMFEKSVWKYYNNANTTHKYLFNLKHIKMGWLILACSRLTEESQIRHTFLTPKATCCLLKLYNLVAFTYHINSLVCLRIISGVQSTSTLVDFLCLGPVISFKCRCFLNLFQPRHASL